MSAEVKAPISLVATYLWIGFVVAISFMEAWLKFRAPGVNLQIGLGIGRLVFNALNKVEWVFAVSIIISYLISKQNLITFSTFLFFVPVILLIIQTVWLLPALDLRAEMHIKNQEVPPSSLHIYYVFIEVIKVTCLFIFGIKQFK